MTRDDFGTVADGKPVTGRLDLPFGWLVKASGRGRDFGKDEPLYVQLEHETINRGAFRDTDGKPDLDAWTGRLFSNIVKVDFAD
ncbi:MAG: hypothetical protein K2X87_06255 [Gemmataceae bacterium]|nr:hypothetical protein [Gemmataceae bacterium]